MVPDGLLVNTISAVVAALLASFLYDKMNQGRIRVRRLQSATSKIDKRDIDSLVDLYLKYFNDSSEDYSAEEVRSFFERDAKDGAKWHIEANDIYLVAKHKGNVVGFLFCHHYPSRKKAIVSYFAIDDHNVVARKKASKALLNELGRLLESKTYDCEYLFFDVKRPGKGIAKEENSERKSRIQHFLSTARACGKVAYVLCFDYHGPKISMEDDTVERPLVLMFIPFACDVLTSVPKSLVLEFLNFVYLDCYGDHYAMTDVRFTPYRQHLLEGIKGYESDLPDIVPVSRDRFHKKL